MAVAAACIGGSGGGRGRPALRLPRATTGLCRWPRRTRALQERRVEVGLGRGKSGGGGA